MISAAKEGWAAVRTAVVQRDHGCIAPRQGLVGKVAASDPCLNKWGEIIGYDALEHLELDHVSEHSTKGRKPPDDEAHLVLLCPHHHRGTGPAGSVWATANRDAEREYLRQRYPEVWNAS